MLKWHFLLPKGQQKFTTFSYLEEEGLSYLQLFLELPESSRSHWNITSVWKTPKTVVLCLLPWTNLTFCLIYIIEKSTNRPHTNIYTQIRIKFVDKNIQRFYSLLWGEFWKKNKDTGFPITWSTVEKSDIAFCTLSSFFIFLMRKQQCVD